MPYVGNLKPKSGDRIPKAGSPVKRDDPIVAPDDESRLSGTRESGERE
jgi:hypothetical protein